MRVGGVRLLGPVQFVDDHAGDVALRSASMRRLLAVLAVSRSGPLRSEQLVDLLGVSPSALRTSVSRLRSRIGERVIRSEGTGYRLDCQVDAQRFADLLDVSDRGASLSRIDEALALWHGPALEEFRHEPWAEAEAARLDEMRLVAVEDRMELLIAQLRCGEAAATLEAHVAANPLRDRARGLLMEALAGDGRQADSLRAFQDYRSFLAEECGTEPSASVRSIEQRVAAGCQDPAGGSRATPLRRGPSASRRDLHIPLSGALRGGAELVGRTDQLELLDAELAAVRHGLRVVRVSGEAGIGKTALLASFARSAHDRSATVLYGRCDETSVPLQPLRSIVRNVVEHVPLQTLCEHVERHGGELGRVAPHLRTRTWVPTPFEGAGEVEQFHLFEAVADLMGRVASDRPVVLALDDMHWAEPTSLLLLRHLVRSLVDAPVLVIISVRGVGDSLPTDLRVALADVERVPTRRIELTGLDESALIEMTATMLGVDLSADAPSLAALRSQTAGHPLYASQLLLHLRDQGATEIAPVRTTPSSTSDGVVPPGLVDVLWRRVHELGPATSAVMRACSVLAPVVGRDVLAAVLGIDQRDVDRSVDVALAAGLLTGTESVDSSVRFTHALVAHAIYGEMTADQRRAMHRSALDAITARTVGAPGQSAAIELALHAVAAGDHRAAQRWSLLAGELALDHLAPTEAGRWFRVALEHALAAGAQDAELAALEVRLGTAQFRAGDAEARSTLLSAAGRARRSGAGDVLVEAVLAQDHGLMRIGSIDDELLDMVQAAMDVADPADEAIVARLLAMRALHLVHTPRTEERFSSARRAVDLIERSDAPLLLPQVISSLLFGLAGPGTLEQRRDLARRAVVCAERSPDWHLRFWTSRAAHHIAIESADPVMAAAQLQRMSEIATTVPEARLRWVSSVALAFQAMMEARLDDADALIETALELGLQVGDPDATSVYAAQFFVSRSFAGRYGELLPLLEETTRANPGVRAFELAHAITLAVTGRTDRPRELLRAAATCGFADVPLDYLWITSIIGYAVLAIELEEADAARPLFDLLEPFADQVAFTGATSQGYIGAYLGKLASVLGRHDAADDHLDRSLAVARSFGWRYHEATTLVALALSRLRRSGVIDAAATAWLDLAFAIATECRLPSVRAQVDGVRALG